MAYDGAIYAMHHSTCEYPISNPPGATIRVLITDDGLFTPLVKWMLLNRNRHKSHTWQRTAVRAVGFFYDFTRQTRDRYEANTEYSKILSDFVECLIRGTIHEGEDPLGLYWPKQGWKVVDGMVKALTAFSDWCVIEYGTAPINPWRAANWGERMAVFRSWDLRNKSSLLVHLADRQAAWREAGHTREVAVHKRPFIIPSERPPHFPIDHFDRLIEDGFKRPGVPEHAPFHRRYNVRDLLIALLQGAGGLRESEPLHLFVDDVFEYDGRAVVRVHHPQESMTEYLDPLTGEIKLIRREQYLNQIGMLSRNADRSSRRAGWKSPAMKKDRNYIYMDVEWFPQVYGTLFLALYKLYIQCCRPESSYPHLFLTSEGITCGEPYRPSQYEKKLASAIRRIGLVPSKQNGTTSHGLRHMYGQRLKNAGIDDNIIQICMHHKSPLSTLIYTKPEYEKIQEALDSAKPESSATHRLIELIHV